MALLSLVSIPVGMAFMMAIMGSYGKTIRVRWRRPRP